MDFESNNWLTAAIGTAIGSIVTAIVTYLRTRKQVKADIQGRLVEAASEAAHTAIQDVTGVIGVLRTEIGALRQDIANERIACDIKLAGQQDQINRLMAERIATYGEKA